MDRKKNDFFSQSSIAVMTAAFGVLYCVFFADHHSFGELLTNIAASGGLLALLLIPSAALKKDQTILCGKNVLCKAAAAVYLIYFILGGTYILKGYSVFAAERYMHGLPLWVCIIFTGAVCAYIAETGTAAVCRMSTVIASVSIFLAFVFVIFAANDISVPRTDMPEIGLSPAMGGIFPMAAAGLICTTSRGSCRKGSYLGLALLMLAAAFMISGVLLVLGDFALLTEYPAAEAVIYAARELSFRTDGAYFTLWTVTSAAVISLCCACGGDALGCIFPKLRLRGIIVTAAAVIAAVICSALKTDICGPVFSSPIWAVLLLTVFPLIRLSAERKDAGKHEKIQA